MENVVAAAEGVRAALMSGSGSTLFALTESLEQAQAVASAARRELDPTLFAWCGTVNPQPTAICDPE